MPPVKRRRLEDLYVFGKEVTVEDEYGNSATVYLRKLNPLESDTAFSRANAAKAKVLAAKKDKNSDLFLSVQSEIETMTDDELIEIVVGDYRARQREATEARVAEENGWMEDDYLQGLFDAWNSGLESVHIEGDESHEEWLEAERVFNEMQKFTGEVDTEIQGEIERYRESLKSKTREWLVHKTTDISLQTQASLSWLAEHRKCEIWLATKEPDNTSVNYFTKREDVDKIDVQTFQQLYDAYQSLVVEAAEAKKSQQTPISSSSVEEPEQEGTEEAFSLAE